VFCISDWFSNYAIAIQALSSVIQAIATLALVGVTIVYVKKTGESANATKKLAELEVQKIERENSKIQIVQYLMSVSFLPKSVREIADKTSINETELPSLLFELFKDGLVTMTNNGLWMAKQ
jgi:hypothetical protein